MELAASVCEVTLFRFPVPTEPVGSFIGAVADAEPTNPADVTLVCAAAELSPIRFGTDPFGSSGSFSAFAPPAILNSF